jgi:uncharacterized RDD family membrane protein YckC
MTITMNWFYVQNGAQAGPVDDAQLDELARAGTVSADSLVWREGMANWEPYRTARGGTAAAAPPAFPSLATPEAAARPVAGIPAAGGRACAQCGLIFPESDVVTLAGQYVCANCKPVALQRMREGTWMSGSRRYAGFWIRFAALFIDGLIVSVVFYAVAIPLGFGVLGTNLGNDPSMADLGVMMSFLAIWTLVSLAANMAYHVFFLTKYSATPGKLLLGLKVIRSDGGPISLGRAIGRFFANMLSMIVMYIGYLMAAFDGEKRALHDHICDTRVVYKS